MDQSERKSENIRNLESEKQWLNEQLNLTVDRKD